MKRSFLLAVLLCTLHVFTSSQEATGIIPAPQLVSTKPARFKITAATRIVLGTGTNREDEFAASQFNHELAEMKGPHVKAVEEESLRRFPENFVYLGTPGSDRGKAFLKERNGKLSGEMKEEGYFLDVTPDGVVIIAHSPRGRFYGVMSLLQLVERERKGFVVPGVSIHDWPLQKTRGITDDLSRGQVSTFDNFKKLIRFLSRYKLNVYSPYIEDIFVFKSHPLVGKSRGELTAKEMQDLDRYAKSYHVELIPIFETLGHWENILALPEYVRFAEFPGAHTVNISDERVYKILDEMIGEIAGAFSSPYFNMAADESWDVGLGANKQRVAASDIATVHAEHYKRLFEILRKYKKKPLMYGDIILTHPAILDKIPKDVIIVDWQYHVSDSYGSPAIFKAAGFPFVVSPAVWNFTGPYPNFVNTFVNVQNLTREGFQNGSMGVHTSNWNDYGGEALRELNYYGFAWTAECAWQPLHANAADFNRRFFADFFGSANAVEPALAAYSLLSNPLNLFTWHELWRHPMLPLIPASNPLWRVQNIRTNVPLVQQMIGQVRSSATRNLDHLQYLEFVARLNLWFAGKLQAGEAIRKLTQDIPPSASRDSVQRAALDMTRGIAEELTKLKAEFKRLWLTTNRDANLKWLLMNYDRQISYWNEKSEELKRGELWVNPLIESKWIYHPKANPRMRDTTVAQVPKAYYRQSFSIDDTATSATLQLLGDTQAKIWLNGSQLGEVFARRSLSLSVEHQRVKVWDISKKLKKGRNFIAVESANYDPFGSAGINVYVELTSPASGITKVISDSTWRVSETSATGWSNPEFSDASWLFAKPFSHPSPIIRANFSTGRSSWIERQ